MAHDGGRGNKFKGSGTHNRSEYNTKRSTCATVAWEDGGRLASRLHHGGLDVELGAGVTWEGKI